MFLERWWQALIVCLVLVLLGVLMALPGPVVAAPSVADDDAAIQAPSGAPLKVITKEATAISEKPDKASASKPAGQFEVFYVLKPTPGGSEKVQNGFYRVASAPAASAALGWIPQEAVVEWPHTQVIGFRGKTHRQPVLFFATREDAERWLGGDDSVKPISREPERAVGAQVFPLLDVTTVTHKGEKIEIYKGAYLHAGRSGSPPTAGEKGVVAASAAERLTPRSGPSLEQLKRDFKLQIVFVIDTTSSMTPWIDGTKKAVTALVEELAREPTLKGRVELALVCFRDQLEHAEQQKEMEYVAKTICDFKAGADHAEFLRRLAAVKVAPIGSDDWPEDALAGLKKALDDAIGWEPVSLKHVITISDASFQVDPTGYKNIEKLTLPAVVARAQPPGTEPLKNKVLHGLRIVGADPSDHARCNEHFEALTIGGSRTFPGLHAEYKGEADGAKFVEELNAKLKVAVDATKQVVTHDPKVVPAQLQQATGDNRRMIGPILEAVQDASGGAGSAAPTFTQGYAVVVDRAGNKCLEPHVLVTHGRLSLFQSAVNFAVTALDTAGEPGSRDVQKVVKSLQTLATQLNMNEDVSADMPLDKLLSLALGFPVKNGVFALTPAKLAAMTAKDYQAWVTQVRAAESIVKTHLGNTTIWFSLGGKDAKLSDRTAFIKVSDLP